MHSISSDSTKRLICILLAVSFGALGACAKKHDKKSSSPSSSPPPPAAPPSPQPPSPGPNDGTGGQGGDENSDSGKGTSDTKGKNNKGLHGRADASKQPSPEQHRTEIPIPVPGPKQNPAQGPIHNNLERELPEVSPFDTFGGQLINAYLDNDMTGEQVITQVFDNSDLVMSNLAEMSVAIRAMRQQDKFSPQDQEKVLVLEGAMTQYLNEKIESEKGFETALEYGTAVALGLAGGYYSPEILRALQRLGGSAVVQKPLQGLYAVYSATKGTPARVAAWVRGHMPERDVGVRDAVRDTVSKSSELYRRAIGFVNAPSGAAEREMKVFQNIYRVINSPQLAKGYKVSAMRGVDADEMSRFPFSKTGIPGFRIHQDPGEDFLIAELIARGGEKEYYRVTGIGIKAVTKGGEETVVPPKVMTSLIFSRLRSWGERTSALVVTSARNSRDRVVQSRPYQYVTNDPFVRRALQGAAVGVPISAVTLFAIRPLDKSYLTLDQYARELEEQGINLNSAVEDQLSRSPAGTR